MRIARSPSSIGARGMGASEASHFTLRACNAPRLLAGNTPEHRADRHPKSRQVSVPQDASGHDLPGGPDVLERAALLADHAGAFVDGDPQIGEGDSRAQRIGVERRADEPGGPKSDWRR